jgi:hypothetical protein
MAVGSLVIIPTIGGSWGFGKVGHSGYGLFTIPSLPALYIVDTRLVGVEHSFANWNTVTDYVFCPFTPFSHQVCSLTLGCTVGRSTQPDRTTPILYAA